MKCIFIEEYFLQNHVGGSYFIADFTLDQDLVITYLLRHRQT
jgi:hypothetical protein